MSDNAPLGINWLPYHQERVLNAVDNIFNNSLLIKYGLTSWDSFNYTYQDFNDKNLITAYSVPLIQYLHFSLIRLIGGNSLIIWIGPILDRIAILCVAILSGELTIFACKGTGRINYNLIGILSFSIFISSPWSYRMILAPWQEVYFLLYFLASALCFINSYKKFGIVLFCLSCFTQYHWSMILLLTYLSFIITGIATNNTSKSMQYFPPGLNTPKGSRWIILFCALPLIKVVIEKIQINTSSISIKLTNSGVLSRIGIDSVSNIHHGGWFGALQFLGGNRISVCFPNSINLESITSSMAHRISLFNCSLSILGMLILSILSIIGFININKENKKIRFVAVPISFSFLTFCMIFQQSFAAHLLGYSFIFGFIFSTGIVSLLNKYLNSEGTVFLPNTLSCIISAAIVISNIRVSYLTGING